MIGLLDRSAAGYPHIQLPLMNRRDPLDDDIKGSVDAPDRVMDFPGPVDRDDHIIEKCGDIVCALEQQ